MSILVLHYATIIKWLLPCCLQRSMWKPLKNFRERERVPFSIPQTPSQPTPGSFYGILSLTHTSVPSTVQWDPPPFCTVKDSISLRGKSPHTSEFITKKLSGFPASIWSLKWYSPPAVPRAVYSWRYLKQ